ncbi:MAG: response regulator [Saprospiraceae bacterium]
MKRNHKRYCLLLVEDNPGDVRLSQEAFREAKSDIHLEVASDGVEAVAFLQREGEYADKPRPDLIMMDLNLPKWNGKQVLEKIKNDPQLKRIPVIIMTTSSSSLDVLSCYDLHANCFINKPVDFDSFLTTISRIKEFWLETATLPGDIAS